MLSHGFDALFLTLSGFIPVPFLRALSYNESSLNPNAVTKSSNATGLFQVTKTVLNDYNLQHGTKYKLEDTKDPKLNSKIGIELVSRIVKNYQKNHPALAMDWNDPRYVALVVQGFNAGYSEAGGVGFVVGKLEKNGIPKEKITVDTVAQAAKELKASKYLSMPERVSYAKAVARTYFDEVENDKTNLPKVRPLNAGGPNDGSPNSKDKASNPSADMVQNPYPNNENINHTMPADAIRFTIQPLKKNEDVSISSTLGNTAALLLLPLTGLIAAVIKRPKGLNRSQFYL